MRVARPRKRTIRPMTNAIDKMPLPPPIKARKDESSKMTRMSSKTAAPSNPNPTRERMTLSSINVWAEILTLVAPRVNPKKIA
jgi:hypothetical protein